MIDERIKPYATETQARYIDQVNQQGSIRAAAKFLGVNHKTIQEAIARVKRKAVAQGVSPEHDMNKAVPEGFLVKGVSTLYNAQGEVTAQWVKSSADQQNLQQALQEAFEAMVEELPRLAPVNAPTASESDLATVYTLTDSHVGALAWEKEGGADWDLKIAENTLVGCMARLIASSPDSQTGIIAQLGDFLHQDSLMPLTPTSGHVLDSDGRYSKVVSVAVKVLRCMVDMALYKHEKVVVLMAEGNHDLASSIWLRTLFAALYENEPRVTVIDSPLPYYAWAHGKTLLAWHHGHLKKNDQLPLLFAAQFPKLWGNTEKRYVHTGHRHHVEEKEHSGMTVIQHPTLAARDAYAARGGWISERQATSITYHREYGQVGRVTVTPEMLKS